MAREAGGVIENSPLESGWVSLPIPVAGSLPIPAAGSLPIPAAGSLPADLSLMIR